MKGGWARKILEGIVSGYEAQEELSSVLHKAGALVKQGV